jgi:hypothetical protein
VERILPFVELGAADFLLAAYSPYDWRSLELVAREVAPAVRPTQPGLVEPSLEDTRHSADPTQDDDPSRSGDRPSN